MKCEYCGGSRVNKKQCVGCGAPMIEPVKFDVTALTDEQYFMLRKQPHFREMFLNR